MKVVIGAVTLAACLAGAMADVSTSDVFAQAMDFMAREQGTSEVLTLNLVNAGILGILTILVVGFTTFSGGDGTTARSANGGAPSVFTESSLTGGMCFLMYTSGVEEKLSCIQRSACEDPKAAVDYLSAAKYWWKMHKLMK